MCPQGTPAFDHVPDFVFSPAAGVHLSQAISSRLCWIFPSHSAKKAKLTHRCWGSSAMHVTLCVEDCMEDRDTSWPTDSYSNPHLACNKLSQTGFRGSTCPLWEHSSYKQHLFGGWCLAAGHDPVSLAGTGLMQFPHDPSGRKASYAFGAAVFVLSFLKTNTILLIKSHALRMLY